MLLLEISEGIISKTGDSNGISIIFQILLMLASAIASAFLAVVKGNQKIKEIKAENNENKKILTEREKLLSEQVRGSENKLVTLSFEFLEVKNNFLFITELSNKIKKISTNVIDSNVHLKNEYKYLLMLLADEIEDFAIGYYESNMKKKNHEFFPYLTLDFNSKLLKLDAIVNNVCNDIKKIKIIENGIETEHEITFAQYCKKTLELREMSKNLITKLLDSEREYSLDEIIAIFEEFVKEYLKGYIKLLNNWNEII